MSYLEENIKIEWVILALRTAQFTKRLLSKMSKSGCTTCWGLESGNQRILDVIQKSICLETAKKILSDSSSLKIHNRVLVMFGLPSESFMEAKDTIKFVENNICNIHSISYEFLSQKNTPIETYSRKHNIGLKQSSEQELDYGYVWNSKLSSDEINFLFNTYEELDNAIDKIKNKSSEIKDISNIINNNTIKSTFSISDKNHSFISYINMNKKS